MCIYFSALTGGNHVILAVISLISCNIDLWINVPDPAKHMEVMRSIVLVEVWGLRAVSLEKRCNVTVAIVNLHVWLNYWSFSITCRIWPFLVNLLCAFCHSSVYGICHHKALRRSVFQFLVYVNNLCDVNVSNCVQQIYGLMFSHQIKLWKLVTALKTFWF